MYRLSVKSHQISEKQLPNFREIVFIREQPLVFFKENLFFGQNFQLLDKL